jgi:hypothetical protein
MDQNPIVLYLQMKGMAPDAVHDDFVRTLGKDAVAYSTVTRYARSAQFSGRKKVVPPEAPYVERSPVYEAMLTTLGECQCPFLFLFPLPFSSVCELLWRIYLPRSTVHPHPHRHSHRHRHSHLAQSLRFIVRHFRWVPHF